MRRIAITGAAGFLGAHLVEHLLKNTSPTTELVLLDKLTYASRGLDRLRDIEGLFHGRVRILTVDVAEGFSPGVLRELDVRTLDTVIHAAAETHVDNSITDPLPFVRTNVVGTHHVLSLMRIPGNAIQRAIYVSTDEVYGVAPDGVRYVETDRHDARNPYAATKSGAEAIAMAYAHTYQMPITIFNAMNLVGERQHVEKMVPKTIKAVLAGDEMQIHAYPDGVRSGSRFYLHCRSFADAILFALQRPLERKLHVSGCREVTNLELAHAIADVIGKPLRYKLVDHHSDRPGHDLRYCLDDSKIKGMGWTPPVTFDASLARTVRWYLQHPEWLNW